jgi:hydrogenase maturation protease
MIQEQKQSSFVIERGMPEAKGRTQRLPTAIVGLGHPFWGDDSAGSAVVNTLAQNPGLPQNIDLLEGGTNALFDAILSNKYEHIILIDAAEMGRQPGEWICLNADQVSCTSIDKDILYDGHRFDLGNLLALAHALDVMPRKMLIYAVQPLSLEWTGKLSEPVREAVSEIIESILELIDFESSEQRNLDEEKVSFRTVEWS